ncbi:hypothetical protein HDU77_010316, partial [Chytriomyces hyalinus]
MLPSSSMPPPTAHVPTLDINAPVSASFNAFLVANQSSRQSQEIVRDPYQMRHQNDKSQPITGLEAAIPEHKAFVSQKSATAVNDKIMLDLPSKLPSKMQTSVPSQTLGTVVPLTTSLRSSTHRIPLPADPKAWREEEVAQWIFETFGDA